MNIHIKHDKKEFDSKKKENVTAYRKDILSKKYNIDVHNSSKKIKPNSKFKFTAEEYRKNFLSKVHTYFYIKKSMLHYLFPYHIENDKMQSKFSTNKYLNKFNISIPFKMEYYNIIFKRNFNSFWKEQVNNKITTVNSLRLTNRLLSAANSGRIKKCNSSNFYLYKTFYLKLKHKLNNQRTKHGMLLKKESTVSKEIVNEYDKLYHPKFPRYIWVMIFEDPVVEKFTNLFIRHGKKEKAEKFIMKAFLHLHGFMRRDPFFILKKSIQNVRPYVRSKTIPFGKRTKTVPYPISEKQQVKLAMKWIKKETLSNNIRRPLHFKLIDTLNKCSFKKGEAYNKMISMHKEAYSQRAYMYFNYFLKSSKTKNKRPF